MQPLDPGTSTLWPFFLSKDMFLKNGPFGANICSLVGFDVNWISSVFPQNFYKFLFW